jgi:hypothetical protein
MILCDADAPTMDFHRLGIDHRRQAEMVASPIPINAMASAADPA